MFEVSEHDFRKVTEITKKRLGGRESVDHQFIMVLDTIAVFSSCPQGAGRSGGRF